jgi:hypothetical protein
VHTSSSVSRFNWSLIVSVLLLLVATYFSIYQLPKMVVVIISSAFPPTLKIFAYSNMVTWTLTMIFSLMSTFSLGGFNAKGAYVNWKKYLTFQTVIF